MVSAQLFTQIYPIRGLNVTFDPMHYEKFQTIQTRNEMYQKKVSSNRFFQTLQIEIALKLYVLRAIYIDMKKQASVRSKKFFPSK